MPFVWTRPSQTSLRVLLCACCALWVVPAAALAAPEKITPTPGIPTTAAATETATTTATTNDSTARTGGVSFDRRVLVLLAIGCIVGLIAGWVARGGAREPRVRLLHKPKKVQVSVLVPSSPAPRLIPGDSPNATRARWARTPVPRQTPAGAPRPGIIHYLAAFADPAEASEKARVDYLLVSDDVAEEPPDSPGGSDDSLRGTE
jgi:hypothetical protein